PGNDVELVPAQASDSAIAMGLAAKIPLGDRERNKLGDWTRRKYSYRYALASCVPASDLRHAPQQDMDTRRQRLFSKDNLAPAEVCRIEAACKLVHCDRRKKRQGFQPIQQIEIGVSRVSVSVHISLPPGTA